MCACVPFSNNFCAIISLYPAGPITVSNAQVSKVLGLFKRDTLSGKLTVSADAVEPGAKLSYTVCVCAILDRELRESLPA